MKSIWRPFALATTLVVGASLSAQASEAWVGAWRLNPAKSSYQIVSVLEPAPDAWTGVWTLNLAKSSYQIGVAPTASVTRFEPSGDSWKGSQDVIGSRDR
jgi:hypothetical protein